MGTRGKLLQDSGVDVPPNGSPRRLCLAIGHGGRAPSTAITGMFYRCSSGLLLRTPYSDDFAPAGAAAVAIGTATRPLARRKHALDANFRGCDPPICGARLCGFPPTLRSNCIEDRQRQKGQECKHGRERPASHARRQRHVLDRPCTRRRLCRPARPRHRQRAYCCARRATAPARRGRARHGAARLSTCGNDRPRHGPTLRRLGPRGLKHRPISRWRSHSLAAKSALEGTAGPRHRQLIPGSDGPEPSRNHAVSCNTRCSIARREMPRRSSNWDPGPERGNAWMPRRWTGAIPSTAAATASPRPPSTA
jgi:hypothetical protein